MAYSQKQLIELMKSGILHPDEPKPRHIETIISNVFIFEKLAYKVYKDDNAFFNANFRNLASTEERHSFTQKDLIWNRSLSPAIYLDCKPVAVIDGRLEIAAPGSAEEYMIIMNRVNTSDMLFEKIMAGEVDSDRSFLIGRQLAEALKNVRQERLPRQDYYVLFGEKIIDYKNWMMSVPESLTEAEVDEQCAYLDGFRQKNRAWFEGELSSQLAQTGDMHSQNAIMLGDTFNLMDTYPPKEEWVVENHLFPMYRIGTDLWALTGDREIFESFVSGYEEGSGAKADRRLDDLYIVYAAGIRLAYFYMLARTDEKMKEPAGRFHKFMNDYLHK